MPFALTMEIKAQELWGVQNAVAAARGTGARRWYAHPVTCVLRLG